MKETAGEGRDIPGGRLDTRMLRPPGSPLGVAHDWWLIPTDSRLTMTHFSAWQPANSGTNRGISYSEHSLVRPQR